MTFIEKVVRKIWEPIDAEYFKAYEEAKKKDVDELFKLHARTKMKYYPYVGLNMNYVDTYGCPYRSKNGILSGCSMCDYQSEHAKRQGSLLALREKDPKLYALAVKRGFQNTRGERAVPQVIENITGYDSLDFDEMPEELVEELYGKNELFSERPFIYNIEARAASVTREKLEKLKKIMKGKKRISIEFGVEVHDDWLRDNWINKGLANKEIIQAVELLHEFGFTAVGNILIGIPGLTEKQSIKVFVDSAVWLDSIGIDKIVALPLNRKKHTLHGYIYENLRNNDELLKVGLAQKEHTGLPWLFTIVEAFSELYRKYPDTFHKTVMTEINPESNSITNEVGYNASRECSCAEKYITYLNELTFNKEFDSLLKITDTFKEDKCYKEYDELLKRQEKCGNIYDTILIVGKELSKSMFKENWKDTYKILCESIPNPIDRRL